MAENFLYYGDNLEILRGYIGSESVDLVYLDPPFNSNATYNVLYKEKNGTASAAQIKAFGDTWQWDQGAARACEEVIEAGGPVSQVMQAFRTFLGKNDMLAYLAMMAPRLIELRRVLKPTGSIYLHCDPTASHYLKLLMDAVFGAANFRNEIIWRRSNAHNKLSMQFGPIHDVLLFYSRSNSFYFNPDTRPYMHGYIKEWFRGADERGAYRLNMLTGPGVRTGTSGMPWRGFNPTENGRHWAIPSSLREFLPDNGNGMTSQEQLDELYRKGLIVFPKKSGGQPLYKQHVGAGVPYQDIWAYQPYTRGTLYGTEEGIDEDVKWLEREQERLGYQTQKPEGLLERVVRTSSNEGDVVLDPFCGCGTTVAATQKLNRHWIGIDITHIAITLIRHRLQSAFGQDIADTYHVIGEPVCLTDAKALAASDPYQFQYWALGLVGARPAEIKKGADKGIDGRIYFHDEVEGGGTKQIIISVKAGHTSVAHLRDLRGVLERENAQIGILISMKSATSHMRKEAATAGFYESPWGKHPRLQILTIPQLLAGKIIDCPPLKHTDRTFKKAPRARARAGKSAKQPTLDSEE
ncbi:MAG: site-specific DNA-methyltransferase [Armatimonadetes bacterium]|nr:site-specific DNA-methyltransferase [Armatimonadota bacterium]NIO96989.1 site-specific DNA-methyltransferase [Armatimonadota bacterium]